MIGKSAQFAGSKETVDRSLSNNQSKKNSKAVTRVPLTPKVNSVLSSRPNSRSTSIDQPFKSRLCHFGVSASDHVVNSSSGKGAVRCPAMHRPSPPVSLRTNRTFELRCARLEASAAVVRNADKAVLRLQKTRRRVPKQSADGTQETSSHTSICSRESSSSSVYPYRDIACTLRGLKQNARQSSCSLLQEEVLSPVDSLASITVDGSHTSLDTAQGKKSYVRKTSSLLAYPLPRVREKDEGSAMYSSKGLTFQDRFALELPEVRAWHERHQNDQSRAKTPTNVLPWNGKPRQITSAPAKKEDKTNLLRNNSATTVAGTCRNSFSVSQAKARSTLIQLIPA